MGLAVHSSPLTRSSGSVPAPTIMATKLFGKDLSEYDDIDVDELLSELNEEEIEELGRELIDPDDSCVPANQRCWYNTEKAPTGPYNRKALADFIETQAKEEKDWDEPKPFKKEVRGKVFVPPKEEKVQLTDTGDDTVETEWDDVLNTTTSSKSRLSSYADLQKALKTTLMSQSSRCLIPTPMTELLSVSLRC